MNDTAKRLQIEYGDFQTPFALAQRVCDKLNELGVSAETIVEPTCGVGAFIKAAAASFPAAQKIFGVEVNQAYLDELANRKKDWAAPNRIKLFQGDFFTFDWSSLLDAKGSLLVIGNFPWVTNSQQGAIGGVNLPTKINFNNHNGLDAMTGKSNFDISEWMLIQSANWLARRRGYLAILVKTLVARKFLRHLYATKRHVRRAALYNIDAKKYFNAAVEACLLFCEFDAQSQNYDYAVYANLDSAQSYRVGHRNGIVIRDLDAFERLRRYDGAGKTKWRSGVKHDCSDVMELNKLATSWLMAWAKRWKSNLLFFTRY